jgi:hypothetical protein
VSGVGWASFTIERLQAGEAVDIRPRGTSMTGKVEDGQLIHLEPIGSRILSVGDIVLCTVRGRQVVHLIKAVDRRGYQIGNNRGHINGWVGRASIHGIMTR